MWGVLLPAQLRGKYKTCKFNMSDVLKAFECYKFKQEISLSTEHCLNYVRQHCSAGNKFSLTVCIPNEHLRVWYDLKENGNLSDFSYVEILNACIAEHGMKIQKGCTRIESLLYKSSQAC
jgi:hypothetical protein